MRSRSGRRWGNADAAGLRDGVPVIGPLFDAAWKANQTNVELAVEHLGESTEFVVE